MTIQEFRDYMASAETMSTKVKSDTTMIQQTNMEYVNENLLSMFSSIVKFYKIKCFIG